MTLFRLIVLISALALFPAGTGALAKSAANKNTPAPTAGSNASVADDTSIPLPKDLTDNSDPFNAGPSTSAGSGSRYFREQQNFREQDPVRDQEGDRIIRQFE